MQIPRPELTNATPEIRAYIENLEEELASLRGKGKKPASESRRHTAEEDLLEELPELTEVAEPPTTVNIITATTSSLSKRTPRHLYTRQRRGGMGIFDIETAPDDPPVVLSMADQQQSLLLFTNQGRAFRLPASNITEAPVRARG